MHQVFAALAVLAYLAVLALFLLLHRRDPGNQLLRDAVSDYANGPAARLFLIYGLTGLAGSLLLAMAMIATPDGAFPARVPLYLLLAGLLRIGVLRFHTDPGGKGRTWQGRLHLGFAIANFALIYMTVAAAQPVVDAILPAPLAWAMNLLGWVVAASLVGLVAGFLPGIRAAFGLAERIFLVSTALWFLALGIGLLQVPA